MPPCLLLLIVCQEEMCPGFSEMAKTGWKKKIPYSFVKYSLILGGPNSINSVKYVCPLFFLFSKNNFVEAYVT